MAEGKKWINRVLPVIQAVAILLAIRPEFLKTAALSDYNGWGVVSLWEAVGVVAIAYITRNQSVIKNGYVRALCWIFSLGTVVGYSYYTTESWSLLYNGTLRQTLFAFVVCLGYFCLYRNIIALGQLAIEKKPRWFRRESCGKIEEFVFEKHSFLAPFVILVLCSLPYIISFFPGTVAPDARGQLYSYFSPIDMNGHHPIGSTLVMGWFVHLGRILFHSDSIGIFFYTGTQSLVQMLVMAYMVHYQKHLKAPMLLRWCTLGYFGVFPLFQMWGITVIKDSVYYITFALLTLSMLDYLRNDRRLRSAVLLTLSALSIVVFRNEGRYVVFVALVLLFVLARKYWKDFCIALAACAAVLFLIEGVYMPANGIKDGPVKEMLSLPLQQTGRYLWLHADEITEEERAVLEEVFVPELSQVGYVKETSDCVKGFFEDYPSSEALGNYFKVWFRQGLKHPTTYLQATLNQMYGYFYPDRRDIREELAYYGFSFDTQFFLDRDNMSASFAFENGNGRDFLQKYMNFASHLPVVGMLFSAGMHSFLLLGMVTCLLYKKEFRKMVLMIPSLLVLLIAIASPLNASLRYMLPIMIVLPIHIAYCSEKC